MKFKVIRYYFKGSKKGMEDIFVLKFPDIERAEEWKVKTNEDNILQFIILDVIPINSYTPAKKFQLT